MNILAEEQFRENCGDTLITEAFFAQQEFLEDRKELCYKDLNQEDKEIIDTMMEDMEFTLEVIYNGIMGDHYLSGWFKNIEILFYRKDEEFMRKLGIHYTNLKKFSNKFDEAYKIFDRDKEVLKIHDLKLAHCLTYTTFVMLFNEIVKADYGLLNKGKYQDSDIMNFDKVDNDSDSYLISLKYRNREYDKTKNKKC